MTPGSNRKRPQCRTCGNPMAGHRRVNNCPICPTVAAPSIKSSQLYSPPQTPTRARSPASSEDEEGVQQPAARPITREPAFEIPHSGVFRRQNPYFVETPPRRVLPPSPDQELTPTVLVDSEGHTICGSVSPKDRLPSFNHKLSRGKYHIDDDDDDDDTFSEISRRSVSTSPSAIFDRFTHEHEPICTLFRMHQADIPKMRETATRLGVYTTAWQDPKAYLHDHEIPESGLVRQGSWYVAMSKHAGVARQLFDLCQSGMPGAIATEKEMIETPRMATFLHLIFVGMVGGCMAIGCLSML